MKNTNKKQIGNFAFFNGNHSQLMHKMYADDCKKLYQNKYNNPNIDIFETDETPSYFNIYIYDNKLHTRIYYTKQSKGYNQYIIFSPFDEAKQDKYFIYKYKFNDYFEITEKEYDNYIKLNNISKNIRKSKLKTYYYDFN